MEYIRIQISHGITKHTTSTYVHTSMYLEVIIRKIHPNGNISTSTLNAFICATETTKKDSVSSVCGDRVVAQ